MIALLALAASLASPAKPIDPAAWIHHDDYPAQAMRMGWEGETGVRLTIGVDGAVVDCAVLAPSGHDVLDEATCRLLQARAHYVPARDATGEPKEAVVVRRVRWAIPKLSTEPFVHRVAIAKGPNGAECRLEKGERLLDAPCQRLAVAAKQGGMGLPTTIDAGVSADQIAPQ